MDLPRFLVAILLPVGKWASLPLHQLHWSCCCLLSCAPNCWQCPLPKASRGRMGNEPSELFHHLLNQETLHSYKFGFSCPILILHLKVPKSLFLKADLLLYLKLVCLGSFDPMCLFCRNRALSHSFLISWWHSIP